ncbi:MAG: DUF3892 domain-containing protein [Bradyrhizobium sp.]|nr:DUF3892 domain-containing protein [Bradyrhizobium sp.]
MSVHEIQCVNKQPRYNPHERIQNVGGTRANGARFKITQPACIQEIKSGEQFVVRQAGRIVRVIIATHSGHEYIKTENDGIQPDNLLALPECP